MTIKKSHSQLSCRLSSFIAQPKMIVRQIKKHIKNPKRLSSPKKEFKISNKRRNKFVTRLIYDICQFSDCLSHVQYITMYKINISARIELFSSKNYYILDT